jgi:hypothetical protein
VRVGAATPAVSSATSNVLGVSSPAAAGSVLGVWSLAAAGNVEVGGKVTQIAAGDFHACAVLESGTVRCWGPRGDAISSDGNNERIDDDETPASAGDVPY